MPASLRMLLAQPNQHVPLRGDGLLVEEPLLDVLEVRGRVHLGVELAVLDRVDGALGRVLGGGHGEGRLAEDDACGDEVDGLAPVLTRRKRLDEVLDGALEL